MIGHTYLPSRVGQERNKYLHFLYLPSDHGSELYLLCRARRILLYLPGAHGSTCSELHLPGDHG